MKRWLGRLLLAFALFTLGFGLGREVGRAGAQNAPPALPPAGDAVASQPLVRVIYLHGSVRCSSCLHLQKLVTTTVHEHFAAALAEGRVAWQVLNFEDHEALASRYGVVASTLVVTKVGDDRQWRRLDDIWALDNQPDRLAALLVATINGYLLAEQP